MQRIMLAWWVGGAIALGGCYEGGPDVALPDERAGNVGTCDDLGYVGTCLGDVSLWYENAACRVRDCASEDRECGWISNSVGWGCLGGVPSSGGDPGPMVVAGTQLSANRAEWVEHIAEQVVPEMIGSRSQRIEKAAVVAWWALKEGVLDLANPLVYSNCHFPPDQHIGALAVCPDPNHAWQVGISGVQAAWRSLADVEALAKQVHSGVALKQVLVDAAQAAGFAPGSTTSNSIASSTGRLRLSWLLRDGAVGFEAQYPVVQQECFVQGLYWCFGSGWASSAAFAPSRATSEDAIADLEAILDELAPGGTGGGGGTSTFRCSDVGYEGACLSGDVLVWAENETCRWADCGAMGRACDWTDAVGYDCVGDGGDDDDGGLLTVSEIVGGVSYGISQDYGPTTFDGGYSYCQAYGSWGGQLVHCGVDVSIPYGTPLFVPGDGKVLISGESPYYEDVYNPAAGELKIRMAHDGAHVILGHMTRIDLWTGQEVSAGQAAGLSGTQNGGHVHIEVRMPDSAYASGLRTVDPMVYFGW
jgi:hypothetical protein